MPIPPGNGPLDGANLRAAIADCAYGPALRCVTTHGLRQRPPRSDPMRFNRLLPLIVACALFIENMDSMNSAHATISGSSLLNLIGSDRGGRWRSPCVVTHLNAGP